MPLTRPRSAALGERVSGDAALSQGLERGGCDSAGRQRPGGADDDGIDPLMAQVGALFTEAGGDPAARKLTEHPRLGDRIVRAKSGERAQVVFPGVHPVRCDEQ